MGSQGGQEAGEGRERPRVVIQRQGANTMRPGGWEAKGKGAGLWDGSTLAA